MEKATGRDGEDRRVKWSLVLFGTCASRDMPAYIQLNQHIFKFPLKMERTRRESHLRSELRTLMEDSTHQGTPLHPGLLVHTPLRLTSGR